MRIGAWAAFSLDTTVTYSLTALALISFVGSVSVARFGFPTPTSDASGGVRGERFDIVTAVLVLGGSTLVLTGAIGVVGFPTPCRGCTRDQASGAGPAVGAGRRRDPAARGAPMSA